MVAWERIEFAQWFGILRAWGWEQGSSRVEALEFNKSQLAAPRRKYLDPTPTGRHGK